MLLLTASVLLAFASISSAQDEELIDTCLDSFNVKHKIDESYIGPDGCNTCRCRSFGNVCTRKLCEKVPNVRAEANKCVDNNGNLHQIGEEYTHVDGCNTCVCREIGGVCTRKFCLHVPTAPRATAVCKDANGNGKEVGETWEAADGCNTCRCGAIGPICTRKGCAGHFDFSAVAVDGQVEKANEPVIADETGDSPCKVNGTTKFPGDTWLTDDSCNICTCTGMDGKIECTDESCRARFLRLVAPEQLGENSSSMQMALPSLVLALAVYTFNFF